jgi:hypothetical protein
LDKIVRHVVEAEAAYLGRLGSSFRLDEHAELESEQRAACAPPCSPD